MAFTKFVPVIYSSELEKQRERQCVAAQHCNRKWEGEIKQKGDRVKILGVKRPTISQYTKGTTNLTPEDLTGEEMFITVDRADMFNFLVDDIDKVQATGDIMSNEMQEAAAAMAESMDSYIYGKYAEAGTTVDCANLTSATVFSKISSGLKALWTAKVPKSEEIVLEVSPGFMEKLMLAEIVHGTENKDAIESGAVGIIKTLGVKVYLANGISNDGTYDYCFLRTKKAIGLVDQYNDIEPYRPQGGFSDALKGLGLYGASVVRPMELVALKASYAAETAV